MPPKLRGQGNEELVREIDKQWLVKAKENQRRVVF